MKKVLLMFLIVIVIAATAFLSLSYEKMLNQTRTTKFI